MPAVQGDRADARRRELLRHPVGTMARLAEQDAGAKRAEERGAGPHTVVPFHLAEGVLRRSEGEALRADLVSNRVALVLAHEADDVAAEGRREEHRLAFARGHVEDLAHRREEAHVGHAVGLVDDHEVHFRQARRALVEQVEQSAGARDDGVDPPSQRLALRLVAHAAVDGHESPVLERGQRRELALDLGGELTGRGEHERAGRRGLARSRRASIGSPNASVLPDPVGARPHTSRPASASGIAAVWISKG